MITLLHNISEIITLQGAYQKKGIRLKTEDLSLIKDAAVVKNDTEILWVGKKQDLPDALKKTISQEVNCQNQVVTPGLIDAHTHLVFAGNRAHEYWMRLSGASYEEIAAAGGGITYSSQETLASSDESLLHSARRRLEQMYQQGLVGVEIKSGYALTLEGELRLLNVINSLKNEFKDRLHVHRTLMSAHAVHKNFTKETYIDQVILPSIQNAYDQSLIDSLDIFHEMNYFDKSDVDKIFNYAQTFHIPLRLHADELNNNHGAQLASQWKCLSADHLLQTDSNGASSLAQAGVIATLLPGTALFLGKPFPPAPMLYQSGCAIAIASDFNPGSHYNNDLFQIARISAPSLKINPCTLWAAITLNAARAISLKNYGVIAPGFSSHLLLWESPACSDLLYDWTVRPQCQHI